MAAAVTMILGLYWLSQLGLELHRAAKMRRRITTQTHGFHASLDPYTVISAHSPPATSAGQR
jgi:hypothetical protein